MPAETPSSVPASRSSSARAARSASPAASGRALGAPNTHRAASPSNLLTHPQCLDRLDDDREERVQQLDHLVRPAPHGQAGRVDHVDEHDRDLAQLAAQLDLAVARERGLGHLAPDVAPEQVAQPLALLETGRHRVEAGLEQPDLAAVVDRHAGVVEALLDLRHRPPHRGDRLGHGARGDRDRERADQQADPGEKYAAASAPDPRGIDQAGRGDHEDAEQRDAGAERPRHGQPPHPRAAALRRRLPASASTVIGRRCAPTAGMRPHRWSRRPAASSCPRSARTIPGSAG